MIFVCAGRVTPGVKQLIERLDAQVIRFDGNMFWAKGVPAHVCGSSYIVNWGGHVPPIPGLHVFNPTLNDLSPYDRKRLLGRSVRAPSVYNHSMIGGNFCGRSNDAVSASDLLGKKSFIPDYWIMKHPFKEEYDVHISNGNVVKVGRRVADDGAHDWIRSDAAGWKTSYTGMRTVGTIARTAQEALVALRFTSGMVQLATLPDSPGYVTFDVSTTPRLDSTTIPMYAALIRSWVAQGGPDESSLVEPAAEEVIEEDDVDDDDDYNDDEEEEPEE